MTDRLVQGLWIGDELSAMERLSISSFLAHGHEFELYTYGPVRGVPDGARLRDAAELIPEAHVFLYRDHASYAGFANHFRYKLLLKRGGWWVDLDSVCLAPFEFDGDLVFSAEHDQDGRDVPNAGFIKAAPGHEVIEALWTACGAKDPARLSWGETGPRLVRQTLARLGRESCVQPSQAFCPVPFFEWRRVLDPDETWSFPPSTRAVHLWNEMWRRAGQDKDASYHPGCLYERLKARYGITPDPRA